MHRRYRHLSMNRSGTGGASGINGDDDGGDDCGGGGGGEGCADRD